MQVGYKIWHTPHTKKISQSCLTLGSEAPDLSSPTLKRDGEGAQEVEQAIPRSHARVIQKTFFSWSCLLFPLRLTLTLYKEAELSSLKVFPAHFTFGESCLLTLIFPKFGAILSFNILKTFL